MLDKIKSIKKINHKSKRYDIGVEKVHNFYANDILVHNCQNLNKEYSKWVEEAIKHQFYVTEKLDGSSSTFYYRDGEFGICSRNLELKENDDNTFCKVAAELGLKEKLTNLGRNLALQGELIGEGIQGNRYKIKGHTVRFFNVFDIDKSEKVGYDEFHEIMNQLQLQTVPITAVPGFKLPETVAGMVEFAEAKSIMNPHAEREGVVIRSRDNKISFKAISNKFLLKSGE